MANVDLEPFHRFHSYCRRFPTEIVEAALDRYTQRGESVLDPFCGSGTTLVACLAHGRTSVAADIDTLAGMLTQVKCSPRTRTEYDAWRDHFAVQLAADFQEIGRAWTSKSSPPLGGMWPLGSLALPVPSFAELPYWFPPQLTAALAAIAQAAHDCGDDHFEHVALIALSASIIAKWPNTLSYAMDVDHTRPHRRIQRFTLDRVLSIYLGRLDRCIACLGELHRIYQESGASNGARVLCPHDARLPLPGVEEGTQALAVTSPPYFNAVDYPRAHRLSVCWMNGYSSPDLVSRRRYIGLRHAPAFDPDAWLKERPPVRRLIPMSIRREEAIARRLCAFYADLETVLGHTHTALKRGGHAVYVIANNVIRGERIASHRILAELGRRLGFTDSTISSRAIESLRRRFPVGPFGFDGPMTHEYLVVLRKLRRQLEGAMRDAPDQDPLQALHEKLLSGDRLASEELSRLVLPPLQEEIARRFPRADEQLVSDGVIDAILDYCASPHQFNASKDVPLERFLATAAWRNVDNMLIGERRRRNREKKVGGEKRESDVALDPAARNIRREEEEECTKRRAAILAALDDPKDKEIMALRLDGVRDTAAYARILTITDLPIHRQREEVKRHKDRITRFLRRKGLLP